MKLSDLIKEYGDDNVEAQFLDHCATSMSAVHGATKISFFTKQPFGANGTEKLGMILWLDRDRVKQTTAAAKVQQ